LRICDNCKVTVDPWTEHKRSLEGARDPWRGHKRSVEGAEEIPGRSTRGPWREHEIPGGVEGAQEIH